MESFLLTIISFAKYLNNKDGKKMIDNSVYMAMVIAILGAIGMLIIKNIVKFTKKARGATV